MKIEIPSGLMVSVWRADDPNQKMRAHTMRRTVVGELVHQDSGAIVVEVGEWMILTRSQNVVKS